MILPEILKQSNMEPKKTIEEILEPLEEMLNEDGFYLKYGDVYKLLEEKEERIKALEEENKRLNLKVKEAAYWAFIHGDQYYELSNEDWEEWAKDNNIDL